MRAPALVAALLLLVAASTASSGDPVARALSDELARTMGELRLGDEPRPYFVSYRLDDLEITEVGASLGSLVRSAHSRSRYLGVELRVGSPRLDNTNFFSLERRTPGIARSWYGSVRVPLDDDYRELRRQTWLATDEAYKQAVEDLARKSAALESRRRADDLPDFTATEPTSSTERLEAEALDQKAAHRLVEAVSAEFREAASVYYSAVRLRAVRPTTRYLNSEASRFTRAVPLVQLAIVAATQAEDGTPIEDVESFYGRALADLPPLEELRVAARRLADRLSKARRGASLERYNGPVLFIGQAAAELFRQHFAAATAGWRPPVADDERLEQRLARLQGSLNDRLGGRVLARSMRLIDDPTRRELEGSPLLGGYEVDDEAVAARPTTLVERGILKRLLSGRSPSRGVAGSTGNRRGVGVLPSNLLLSTDEGRSLDELRHELMTLVEERDLEFGIVVRRLANPLLLSRMAGDELLVSAGEEGLEHVVEAVKLFPDGREEVLRSPRFPSMSARSFRDVVAASETRTVLTGPLRGFGDSISWFSSASLGSILAGPLLVSVAIPDLLFEELTVAAPMGPTPRPPLIPAPRFSGR